MSEMLANQLFLIRDYAGAAQALERVLIRDPDHNPARRKIIVCYCQIGEVEKALASFHILIRADIDFIINTDPEADDCPCPEIVTEMENELVHNRLSRDYHLILAMLWLYCDIGKSLDYFAAARELDADDTEIRAIYKRIARRHRRLHEDAASDDAPGFVKT